MAVNYMERLAALRGDRQHAAGAHGSVRSAPVLHADEERAKKKKKRKLSRKQKAALAKGRRVMAQMRRAKKGKSMPKRKKGKKRSKSGHVRTIKGRKAIAAYKRAKSRGARGKTRKVVLHGKAAKKYLRSKAGGRRRKAAKHVSRVTLHGKKAAAYVKRRHSKKRKHGKGKKRKHAMGHRKSAKRVAAGKKAARTRKRHKAERAAARRRGGRSHKRGGHKRAYHRKKTRHRKRGGRAKRRYKGIVRRANRSGKFVGKGGRIHGRKRRGGYHRAGRIVRENYSMENPLDMGELATGLGMGLLGYIAADLTDRYMAAGRPPLGGTLYAEASPIYSDYLRLAVGIGMGALPLVGAHFINGAKHRHIRAGLQFFGFGAGIRTLGHLVNDLISSQLKNNSMVGSTVQALYPHEIVSQGQLAGAQKAIAAQGAGALPEHIGAEVAGMGAIPQGLAACCNASSRMLNPALSVLQPIGRSAEGGGAAANYAPPPVALPPPIERIVQQPYAPPADRTRQATPIDIRQPQQPVLPAPTPPARVATVPAAISLPAASMVAAYAPVAPVGGAPSFVGPAGLPASPFGWGDDAPG